ncbi:MAG: hypothetical protein HN541_02840 [Euryarchaeota archaeon]|nr:hypothetical protein [Euryarchaeota archaeon]
MDNSDWDTYSVDSSSLEPSAADHNILSAYRAVEFGTMATFGLSLLIIGVFINFFMLLSPPTLDTDNLDSFNQGLILTTNITFFVTILQLIGLLFLLADAKKLASELNSARKQQNKNLNILASKFNKR